MCHQPYSGHENRGVRALLDFIKLKRVSTRGPFQWPTDAPCPHATQALCCSHSVEVSGSYLNSILAHTWHANGKGNAQYLQCLRE